MSERKLFTENCFSIMLVTSAPAFVKPIHTAVYRIKVVIKKENKEENLKNTQL